MYYIVIYCPPNPYPTSFRFCGSPHPHSVPKSVVYRYIRYIKYMHFLFSSLLFPPFPGKKHNLLIGKMRDNMCVK